MKDQKNDSAAVLERFGRDRRPRTATASIQRVERRPHSQRDAADSESRPASGPKRASYNPNFTQDNRPKFDEKPRRSFGDKPFRGDKSHSGSKFRSGSDSRFGAENRFDETSGNEFRGRESRPSFGDRRSAFGEGRPSFGGPRGPKKFGPKAGPKGPGKFASKGPDGPKKFGPKKDRDFAGRGDRQPGDKPAFRKRDDKPRSYPKYDPARQTGEMRLNRFLAQSGICSRREADDFITAGLVSVNGKIVTELGTKVLPSDEVKFNDSRVEGEKKVYLVLNKPKGYVTSLEDPHAGKLVADLVAGACEERIYPVGRLDKNSLGLLLFTNDGDLTRQLTHPSYLKKKVYQVSLDKPLTRADMDRIAGGITLEDGEIFADEISYVKENKQEIGIEIHSGRNRIVRRIFEFLGYTVTKLDRVYYAGLTKKNLKRGAWRFLTREEVERLKSGRYE
ncbi:MAG: rRNA pseudouridine synthase [Alistipes sp.]|nr:rRNA pseudouridine synthase [Alistipes senegalensis]MCM1250136.1 rRNA pseudouridine synthase [Alistipes sp.]